MGSALMEYGDFLISAILVVVVVVGLNMVLKGLYSEETSWSKIYNYNYTTHTFTVDSAGNRTPTGSDLKLGWDVYVPPGADQPTNEKDDEIYKQ